MTPKVPVHVLRQSTQLGVAATGPSARAVDLMSLHQYYDRCNTQLWPQHTVTNPNHAEPYTYIFVRMHSSADLTLDYRTSSDKVLCDTRCTSCMTNG